MAATLTCDKLNTDKVTLFVRECREIGVKVLPPDVNVSERDFTVEDGAVRYGLAAVKNVGEGAVDAMLQARRQGDGPFKSLFDLCHRAATAGLNRRMMENLIKSGGCDSLHPNRAALLAGLPGALSQGSKRQEEASLGFLDLFGDMEQSAPQLPDVALMGDEEKLGFEKEALGFYMSGHPMRRYLTELMDYGVMDSEQVKKKFTPGSNPQDDVRIAGIVVDKKIHRTKKGEQMAFFTLEDMAGQLEVIAFSEQFHSCREHLDEEGILVVTGTVEPGEEEPKMVATEVVRLAEFRSGYCRELRLVGSLDKFSQEGVDGLADLLSRHKGGSCRVVVELALDDSRVLLKLGEAHKVAPSEELLAGVIGLLGSGSAVYSGKRLAKLS